MILFIFVENIFQMQTFKATAVGIMMTVVVVILHYLVEVVARYLCIATKYPFFLLVSSVESAEGFDAFAASKRAVVEGSAVDIDKIECCVAIGLLLDEYVAYGEI